MIKVRNKKRFAALALCLSLILGLAACGSPSSGSNPSGGGKDNSVDIENLEISYDTKYNISIASGSSGGAYYMVGTALAQVIQSADSNLICSSESTGGTSENISLITTEESTIGMGMADDIVSAYEGKRDYEGMPAENLRAITSGQVNTFQIFVPANSDIKGLADLKGKNISLGPSGAPYFAPDLLESVCGYVNGKDYNGQYLAHDQAADALSDGNVDALIATLAYPAAAFANMAFSKDVRMIALTDEEIAAATAAHATWVSSTIPAGTYNGQTEDVQSLAIPVWLFTYSNMDAEAIYRVTKAIFENVDQLGLVSSEAGKYNLETALEGVVIPVHPGAQKYFDEVMK